MILIIGYPNAGKTTYSKSHNNVLHLDDFPKDKFLNCDKAVAEAEGEVAVEGVYNTVSRRKHLLEAVAHRDEPKICIWIDTPLDECLRRERAFRHRGKHVVLTSHRIFQPPTYAEGWDEIIRITPEDKDAPAPLKEV